MARRARSGGKGREHHLTQNAPPLIHGLLGQLGRCKVSFAKLAAMDIEKLTDDELELVISTLNNLVATMEEAIFHLREPQNA